MLDYLYKINNFINSFLDFITTKRNENDVYLHRINEMECNQFVINKIAPKSTF